MEALGFPAVMRCLRPQVLVVGHIAQVLPVCASSAPLQAACPTAGPLGRANGVAG